MAYPILAETFQPYFQRRYTANFAGVTTSEYFHIMALELLEFVLREAAIPVSPITVFGEHAGGFVRIALCANTRHIRMVIRLIKSLIGGTRYSEPLDKGNMNSRAANI